MKEQKKISTNTLEVLPFNQSEKTRHLDETIKSAPTKGELEHQQADQCPVGTQDLYPTPYPCSLARVF
jgi:hypothetical protein